jgi:pimeloyl-ACP methyl ester carboxylesterase
MPFVTNQGVRIHYEVEGEGQPLLLHHGIMNCIGAWREDGYVDELKNHYRLVMIDARGHGESDKPTAAEAYSAQLLTSDALAVLDCLGISKTHYWGYSLGALVGYSLLQSAPQRLSSVVLGGYSPYIPYSQSERDGLLSLVQAAIELSIERGMEAWLTQLEQELGAALPPNIWQRYAANDPLALQACMNGAVMSWQGVEDCLATSRVPCLIYAGELDDFHTNARRAATAMPDATFMSFPGLDHMGAMFLGGVVLPCAMEFLARHSVQ